MQCGSQHKDRPGICCIATVSETMLLRDVAAGAKYVNGLGRAEPLFLFPLFVSPQDKFITAQIMIQPLQLLLLAFSLWWAFDERINVSPSEGYEWWKTSPLLSCVFFQTSTYKAWVHLCVRLLVVWILLQSSWYPGTTNCVCGSVASWPGDWCQFDSLRHTCPSCGGVGVVWMGQLRILHATAWSPLSEKGKRQFSLHYPIFHDFCTDTAKTGPGSTMWTFIN